jgi:endonuclease YncB( thermonuclease family)
MKALIWVSLPFIWALSVLGFSAKVVGVSDGDTCLVLNDAKEQIKIRLGGIDAPESRQAFGSKAKHALSEKIFGKRIEVKVQTKDRYGRSVADLYLDDRWINLEMVQDGFAWHYKQYSQGIKLAGAEQNARKAKIGLWIDPSPTPPWDFRKGKPPETKSSAGDGVPGAVRGDYWLNTGSNTRHNSKCKHFSSTKRGRFCSADEGEPCGYCGG